VAGFVADIDNFPAIVRLVGGAAPVLPVDDAKSAAGLIATATFYLRTSWLAEPVLIGAAALGGIAAVRRYPVTTILLLGAIIAYVVFLFLFMPLEDRYILPALPAMALLAGGGFAAFCAAIRSRPLLRGVAVFGAVLAISFAGSSALTMSLLMGRPDSRELAVDWLQQNLPSTARVVVAMNPVKVVANAEALKDQAAFDPVSLDFIDRLRLERGRTDGLTAIHLNRFAASRLADPEAAHLLAQLRRAGYRYVVVAQRHDLPPDDFARAVAQAGELLVRFDPSPPPSLVVPPDLRTTILVHDHPVAEYRVLSGLGPRVEVYDLGLAEG
jgi:hypothetical protein